jgi:hypothetical protein
LRAYAYYLMKTNRAQQVSRLVIKCMHVEIHVRAELLLLLFELNDIQALSCTHIRAK